MNSAYFEKARPIMEGEITKLLTEVIVEMEILEKIIVPKNNKNIIKSFKEIKKFIFQIDRNFYFFYELARLKRKSKSLKEKIDLVAFLKKSRGKLAWEFKKFNFNFLPQVEIISAPKKALVNIERSKLLTIFIEIVMAMVSIKNQKIIIKIKEEKNQVTVRMINQGNIDMKAKNKNLGLYFIKIFLQNIGGDLNIKNISKQLTIFKVSLPKR